MSCHCNRSCCNSCCQMNGNYWNNSNWGSNCCPISRPQPIVAQKKVCTTFQNQCVEQPIICPIECRRVNNIVYVPRYYPQYEHTCYTQNNNNWSM